MGTGNATLLKDHFHDNISMEANKFSDIEGPAIDHIQCEQQGPAPPKKLAIANDGNCARGAKAEIATTYKLTRKIEKRKNRGDGGRTWIVGIDREREQKTVGAGDHLLCCDGNNRRPTPSTISKIRNENKAGVAAENVPNRVISLYSACYGRTKRGLEDWMGEEKNRRRMLRRTRWPSTAAASTALTTPGSTLRADTTAPTATSPAPSTSSSAMAAASSKAAMGGGREAAGGEVLTGAATALALGDEGEGGMWEKRVVAGTRLQSGPVRGIRPDGFGSESEIVLDRI